MAKKKPVEEVPVIDESPIPMNAMESLIARILPDTDEPVTTPMLEDEPEVDEELEDEEGEVFDEYEREHYETIKERALEILEYTQRHESAKSRAKAAKENLEDAMMCLNMLILEGPRRPDPQKTLPFPVDDWRATLIEKALSLKPAQLQKMRDAGIHTVGQFENVRAGNDSTFPDGLSSIPGIGHRTIDAMENDIVEWLGVNARDPEPAEEPVGKPIEVVVEGNPE